MTGSRFIFAALVVAGVILSGCGDNDPVRSTEPDEPLFKLTLLDRSAQPADGFEVGFINHSEFLSKPSPTPMSCPSTDVEFSLPAAGTVWLDVADYYGRCIWNLIDGDHFGAGSSTVRWDGVDSTGAAVIPGFYQFVLQAVSAADTMCDTTWLVLETASQPTMVGQTTDGILAIDDTLLLPCLLGSPPAITVNDGGSAVEVGDFYQDSVTIFIQSPNETTTWYFGRALIVGNNHFVIDLSRYYEGNGVFRPLGGCSGGYGTRRCAGRGKASEEPVSTPCAETRR